MSISPRNIPCIDKVSGERVAINAKEPKRFSNKILDCDMMFLMRDENLKHHHNAHKPDYFKGKNRRFDLQVQFRLKQTTSTLWYGIELDDSLQLGTVQRIMAKAGLGFCQKMNPGSFYSQISNEPCMAFKVENSMDAVHVSKRGEVPPSLGEPVVESHESIARRAKHGMSWNTEDTYTISCYSSYFDFVSWSCMNLPGLPRFEATRLVGKQPMRFVVYTLDDETKSHVSDNKNYIFNLEISHPTKTRLGPAAMALRKWRFAETESSLTSATTELDDSDMETEYEEDVLLGPKSRRVSDPSEVKVLMRGVF